MFWCCFIFVYICNMKLYKIVPHEWDENKQYLIARKEISRTSNRKCFTFYFVENRMTKQNNGQWIKTDSLKGVHFITEELSLIKEL